MISLAILIPIYNLKIINLVDDLSKQISKIQEKITIFCIDDFSTEEIEKQNRIYLQQNPFVIYQNLTQNIGRSKIRNLLAQNAKNFSHFLFIDNDSQIINKDFLNNYIQEIKKNINIVFSGGQFPPYNYLKNKYELNWTYDKIRQSTKHKKNKKIGYLDLKSFNFCIPKDIFNQIKFPEWIVNYGHEDSYFSYELIKNKIDVKFIDNPLLHIGLEKNKQFLNKTNQSILNLIQIKKYDLEFLKHIKIWDFYQKHKFLLFIIKPFSKFILNYLSNYLINSKNPNLKLFDLYKLIYLTKNDL